MRKRILETISRGGEVIIIIDNMNYKSFLSKSAFIFLALFTMLPLSGEVIRVNSISALQQAVNSAKPGDKITVVDGVYSTSGSIIIKSRGTEKLPVSIEAENTGAAEINGTHGFLLSPPASHIIIKGFHFTHKSGACRIEPGVTNCIITRNIFECIPSESKGSKPYLNISGDDNEISYNTFRNKKDEGQMISVQGPGGNRMAKRVHIHHNHFHDFPKTGLNNCSAIQIGLSGRSMDSAFCIVEYNLFERTEGENEGAICHKSCRNIIRFNTFGERSEECSVRHGNGSEVYGNFFINTTGLRFSGDDHLIYANYFSGCTKAIVCQNGDGEVKAGSALTCHDRADRVRIVGNSVIDCKASYQMAYRENGLGATDINFSDNLIRGSSPVSVKGTYTGAVWKDNIIWNTTGGDIPADGYRLADVSLKEHFGVIAARGNGYPGIQASNRLLTSADAGHMAQ